MMTDEQVRAQLSDIEPSEKTYEPFSAEDIPALERMLRYPEAWLAARAVFALSRLRDSRVLAVLHRAASDARSELRVAVAAAAQHLTPADANKLLIQGLNDTEAGVRKFAVTSISSEHSDEVHQRLQGLADSEASQAVRSLAQARLAAVTRRR